MGNFNMNLTIKPTWDIVTEVHEKTLDIMNNNDASREVREATMMVATELIENAVKYGASQPDGKSIEFDLTIVNESIMMSTKNGVREDAHAQVVMEHVNRISESNNPAELYTQRLMELLESDKAGESQLGLYRIAYEGQFNLSCVYDKGILQINAKKTF